MERPFLLCILCRQTWSAGHNLRTVSVNSLRQLEEHISANIMSQSFLQMIYLDIIVPEEAMEISSSLYFTPHTEKRQFYWSNRLVSNWNRLPQIVLNNTSVYGFKRSLRMVNFIAIVLTNPASLCICTFWYVLLWMKQINPTLLEGRAVSETWSWEDFSFALEGENYEFWLKIKYVQDENRMLLLFPFVLSVFCISSVHVYCPTLY